MKLSEFHTHLLQHSEHTLTFILPDGDLVPAHFHITEAGRVDKSFIDCGSPLRRTATCSLQAWVAADLDHRFTPGKLAGVPKAADPLFLGADLDVEIEYEDCAISQFPVHEATAKGSTLSFHLGAKHTDCLAKDVCLPQAAVGECCGATGCC
ncbi:MAG: DUF6428 family protein [Chthoniobacteraceae bacterium]